MRSAGSNGSPRQNYRSGLSATIDQTEPMRRSERKWEAAVAEHELVVRGFLSVCGKCATADWHRPPAPNKWSTAAVALHICNAYEVAGNSVTGGPGMQLRVSRPYAWFLRTAVLPFILATKRFPRATAPREVRPNAEEAEQLTPEAASIRLRRAADSAVRAFRDAGRNPASPRMNHAYFGAINAYTALRLLSAHTRHHTRALRTRS